MNKYISNNLDYILNLTNQKKPKIGIVLGSGLKSFANIINNKITIKYSDLNGFPQPKVEGHQGELIIGNIESKLIACLSRRSHPYEGDISSMVNPIRTLKMFQSMTRFSRINFPRKTRVNRLLPFFILCVVLR